MRLWRICRARYAREAYAGEGARLYAGRWNSRGVRMVYASTSLALAAVETFVHLEPKLQPDDLVSMEVEVPESLVLERLAVDSLPKNWHTPQNESLRRLGDAWIGAGRTVGLQVPSAVIQGEWNILLNPLHKDFPQIRVQAPIPFRFDFRMFQ